MKEEKEIQKKEERDKDQLLLRLASPFSRALFFNQIFTLYSNQGSGLV